MGRVNWQDVKNEYYNYVHRRDGKNKPTWRGVQIIKYPNDLILYAEAIFENKPDYIIEIGTGRGGSAIFFSDMLSLFHPEGHVITVDVAPNYAMKSTKVEYINGSSLDQDVIHYIEEQTAGYKTMVVLDGYHGRIHVKWELKRYAPMVTKGQFLVAEDCYTKRTEMYGPGQAVEWFLNQTNSFVRESREDKYIMAVTRAGWLRRVK